ncbi:mitochondrial FAD carrier protein [Coprinopsis cinerea okayama7|uniref:Mitochondrial FAD carrier protein n=1 Tax=Coprinopsis cinerea (strain Okayama-7 / 130 / ATCC MYA-4618 / FGSC 9003) TaxID=240176 RepID=A8P7D9_COPC7|nr:mitochondrial FAD carrier protein [Coprinopsis cinerea okayama7\|eukprot:XP_001839340.1 mitochondrial FAD carrier protein [Coprinopsis cinerea okayama7\
MSAPLKKQPASFFSSTAVDHAVAGLSAGVVTTLVMNPLDLLKIKFQVNTGKPVGGMGMQMWLALKGIQQSQGWKGLYRGISPNIAGNASSWGLYFLFYQMLKKRAAGGDVMKPLSAPEYLLCSAQASAVTAVITNPFWLIRVRMFATTADTPDAYRGLWDGLTRIFKTEGVPGLFRGTTLALVGVGNGAIQFMAYEKMKGWAFERKRRKAEREGMHYDQNTAKLSNFTYSVMSITSKLIALATTYPYQVVRSRVQNNLQQDQFPNIPTTVKRTWKNEGVKGFYRGLGTSLVRVLPGTCVTFVVYENVAWLLRTTAARREQSNLDGVDD